MNINSLLRARFPRRVATATYPSVRTTWSRHADGHRGCWDGGGLYVNEWKDAPAALVTWGYGAKPCAGEWKRTSARGKTLAPTDRPNDSATQHKTTTQRRKSLTRPANATAMSSKCPKCEKTVYFGKWPPLWCVNSFIWINFYFFNRLECSLPRRRCTCACVFNFKEDNTAFI